MYILENKTMVQMALICEANFDQCENLMILSQICTETGPLTQFSSTCTLGLFHPRYGRGQTNNLQNSEETQRFQLV